MSEATTGTLFSLRRFSAFHLSVFEPVLHHCFLSFALLLSRSFPRPFTEDARNLRVPLYYTRWVFFWYSAPLEIDGVQELRVEEGRSKHLRVEMLEDNAPRYLPCSVHETADAEDLACKYCTTS